MIDTPITDNLEEIQRETDAMDTATTEFQKVLDEMIAQEAALPPEPNEPDDDSADIAQIEKEFGEELDRAVLDLATKKAGESH